MLDRLYDRIIALSQSPRAPYALAAIAFAESSVFPIPPDVILAPMSLAQPKLAWRFAFIATIASVLGGMVGYGIGALLFDTIGQWLIHVYGYADKMAALKETYAHWGALVILDQGPHADSVQARDHRQRAARLQFPAVRATMRDHARRVGSFCSRARSIISAIPCGSRCNVISPGFSC